MNKEEAVKIAKELVEKYNTEIERINADSYVIIFKDLLFDEDIKRLLPYFSKYSVAIYADGTSKLRVSIK